MHEETYSKPLIHRKNMGTNRNCEETIGKSIEPIRNPTNIHLENSSEAKGHPTEIIGNPCGAQGNLKETNRKPFRITIFQQMCFTQLPRTTLASKSPWAVRGLVGKLLGIVRVSFSHVLGHLTTLQNPKHLALLIPIALAFRKMEAATKSNIVKPALAKPQSKHQGNTSSKR